jgi:hypothetical protein
VAPRGWLTPPAGAAQVGFKRDQYKKCANLLEAVGQLMEFFQAYEAVPKIRALAKRLAVVQQALQVGPGGPGCAAGRGAAAAAAAAAHRSLPLRAGAPAAQQGAEAAPCSCSSSAGPLALTRFWGPPASRPAGP